MKCILTSLADAPPEYWDLARRRGTIYQTKEYQQCLAEVTRPSLVAMVMDGTTLVGGSAVQRGKGIGRFWRQCVIYYGPFAVRDDDLPPVFQCLADFLRRKALVAALTVNPPYADLIRDRCDLTAWRSMPRDFLHWDITPSLEDIWRELPKGKRSSVNRAEREKVIIEEMQTAQHVREFYTLHTLSMVKGNLAPLPLKYYQVLLERLRPLGMGKGFLALHPQTRQPIAGVMLLLEKAGTATYLAVGHDYEFRNLGGTDLLVWHCLKVVKEGGYRVFDLIGLPAGDSPRAQGIRHFKTLWSGSNGKVWHSFKLIKSGLLGFNPERVLERLRLLRMHHPSQQTAPAKDGTKERVARGGQGSSEELSEGEDAVAAFPGVIQAIPLGAEGFPPRMRAAEGNGIRPPIDPGEGFARNKYKS